MKTKESNEKNLQRFDGRPDETDPRHIFSMTATQLLTEALKGEFSIEYLVRRELANRGVNQDGIWVGFPQAKELHHIK
jgi:hypothetical protein